MKKYIESNRKRWNELADIHFKSKFYNVENFKKGGISISDLEINEVGDVKGKNLLHLQCHFGKDTLSWGRLGANVTGVDFSDKAIQLARKLSKEIGIVGNFIHSNVLKLENTPLEPESFDIVYTSHGTIWWLPDLKKWAQLITTYLKPGGMFYIADSHPTGSIFDDESEKDLIPRFSYFHTDEPLEFDYDGSYAGEDIKIKHKKEYGWMHNLGYIINCLIEAGLRIKFIHEYPYASWKQFPFLVEREDGWWDLPDIYPRIPLTFTLKAVKPK